MKLRLPWNKKKQPLHVIHPLGESMSSLLFQALVDIRDHPKHAKRKAKEAISGPPLWRYLYRALIQIRLHPERAEELASEAIRDARQSARLARVFGDIRKDPKHAIELAMVGIHEATKFGAAK